MMKPITPPCSRRLAVTLGCWLAGAGTGCLIPPAGRIEVPKDVLRNPGPGADASNRRSRYVVRMTDGDQDWEFQLPEIATAYEVRVPLRGRAGSGGLAVDQAALTAADKEIVGQRDIDERARGEKAEAAGDGDGDGAGPAAGEREGGRNPRLAAATATAPRAAATPKSSYLLTLAKVKDLYRTRNYEIALVELVALEREYPNDERILSMKGSLYEKVGRRQLAREAWEAVLAINPYNLQVAEALQRLGK
jgi:tetratricopeptide (TPR) repeat protein